MAALDLIANTVTTTVALSKTAPASGTVETWVGASWAAFPAASVQTVPTVQFRIRDVAAQSEIILVTNVSGTSATVTRGVEGTTPVTHAPGFTVANVLTAGAVLAAMGNAIAATPNVTARPTVMLGAVGASSPALSDFTGFNALLGGRTLDIELFMQDLDSEPLFYSAYQTWATQLGSIMMSTMSTSVHSAGAFTAGTFDTTGLNSGGLAGLAASAAAYGKPIVVRMFHEMNGSWNAAYGYTIESAASFVGGWQHIVNVFRAHGATNVLFCWCPNVWGVGGFNSSVSVDPTIPDSSGVSWYPGDAYVDIIALDGYMTVESPTVYTPAQLFLSCYQALVTMAPSKPFAIAEFGVAADSRLASAVGGKAGWYALFWAMVKNQMPKCVLVNQWQRVVGSDDYTISSSGADSAAAAAFVAGVQAAPFVPSPLTFGATPGFTPHTATAPAFPATTVVYTNGTGYAIMAYVTNGTASMTTQINGATGPAIASSATLGVLIPAGGTFKATYASGTPTWVFSAVS